MKRLCLLGILPILGLGCGGSDEPPAGLSPDGIEPAIVEHFRRLESGRAPGDLGAPAMMAGSAFSAGVDRFEVAGLEIGQVSGNEVQATGRARIDWRSKDGKAAIEHEQPVTVRLVSDSAAWRVAAVLARGEPARHATAEDRFLVPEPMNPTLDDATRIESFRLAIEGEDRSPHTSELADLVREALPRHLREAGLAIEIAEAGAIPLTLRLAETEILAGYPVYAEGRFRARFEARVPFTKPAGSWAFEHRWNRTARAVGFSNPQPEATRFLAEAADDLARRFSVALAAQLAAFAASPGSAVRSAHGAASERILADLPAGAPRPGPGGLAIVRTRGQQIHAYAADGSKVWEAGQIQWPSHPRDPLAWPAFTHLPPTVEGGTVHHPIVDPDPPHASWIARVDATGRETGKWSVDGIPCSNVLVEAPGLAAAVWRKDEVDGGRYYLLRFSPEGKETGASDTGWIAPEPRPIEVRALPDGAVLLAAPGRLLAVGPDGDERWRADAPGVEPFRDRLLVAGGEVLRIEGARILAGGAQTETRAELDRPIDWIAAGEEGRLLAGAGGTIQSFAAGGKALWRRELSDEVEIPPLASGGRVVVGSRNRLWSLSAATGEVEWETPIRAKGCRWAPVPAGEGEARAILVVGALRSAVDPDGER